VKNICGGKTFQAKIAANFDVTHLAF
jgi:hypothetical protein